MHNTMNIKLLSIFHGTSNNDCMTYCFLSFCCFDIPIKTSQSLPFCGNLKCAMSMHINEPTYKRDKWNVKELIVFETQSVNSNNKECFALVSDYKAFIITLFYYYTEANPGGGFWVSAPLPFWKNSSICYGFLRKKYRQWGLAPSP